MKVSKLINKRYTRVLGIDASTKSFAYCLFVNGKAATWGEIVYVGNTVFERLGYGQRAVEAIREELKPDLVVIESAVYVQNKKTVIDLAYAFGAAVSPLVEPGVGVESVVPTAWQYAIGNGSLTADEKNAVREEFPGKSNTWYTAKFREIRKGRTKDWVFSELGIETDSDNLSDAIAIAYYGNKKFGNNE